MIADIAAEAKELCERLPSVDPIDRGVWRNGAYLPQHGYITRYLELCTPFNMLRLIAHIEKLQTEMTNIQNEATRRVTEAQAVSMDVCELIGDPTFMIPPADMDAEPNDIRTRVHHLCLAARSLLDSKTTQFATACEHARKGLGLQ